MTLLGIKGLAALTIFVISVITGLLSIVFANRYRKQLEIGDAVANGIFIGAALFHLLPEAVIGFQNLPSNFAYSKTIILAAISYLIFWIIESLLLRKEQTEKRHVHIGILILVLSIHAVIAGLTLGISETFSMVSILFIAIVAHKGFETFAFVINIYRQLGRSWQIILLLLVFSLITPIGIVFGILSDALLPAHLDNVLTACFGAIAAGTFIYIGTVHSHHLHNNRDSYHQYTRVVATIVGVVLMGFLGIWI